MPRRDQKPMQTSRSISYRKSISLCNRFLVAYSYYLRATKVERDGVVKAQPTLKQATKNSRKIRRTMFAMKNLKRTNKRVYDFHEHQRKGHVLNFKNVSLSNFSVANSISYEALKSDVPGVAFSAETG
ncbi:hypothetical protein NQ318_020868 [Aromia moschata]|uniref:Uncharacterized protein n=1 Tax=Aromia moschata TaxID=1265417 RepID=A0AAV8XLG0_9CUCU|nr:hypothetical protein NQ318_020868 [Aromia moschata]